MMQLAEMINMMAAILFIFVIISILVGFIGVLFS